MRIFKSLLVWCCFIPAAILNGGLRQYVLEGRLGTYWALVISGILLSLFILLITWLLLPRIGSLTRREGLLTGFLWMLLTVGFEFVFGLSEEVSFSELLAAYNPMTGNLWLLVVMTTGLAPMVVSKYSLHSEKSVKQHRIIELYRGELWECQMLETLLKDNGMDCFLKNDIRCGYGPIVSVAEQVQVMVNESDIKRGQEILMAFLGKK